MTTSQGGKPCKNTTNHLPRRHSKRMRHKATHGPSQWVGEGGFTPHPAGASPLALTSSRVLSKSRATCRPTKPDVVSSPRVERSAGAGSLGRRGPQAALPPAPGAVRATEASGKRSLPGWSLRRGQPTQGGCHSKHQHDPGFCYWKDGPPEVLQTGGEYSISTPLSTPWGGGFKRLPGGGCFVPWDVGGGLL